MKWALQIDCVQWGIGVAKKAVGRDYIGKRGEAIATAALLDFCGNPEPYFDPHFLGEKCPTYDFLVELLGRVPARLTSWPR